MMIDLWVFFFLLLQCCFYDSYIHVIFSTCARVFLGLKLGVAISGLHIFNSTINGQIFLRRSFTSAVKRVPIALQCNLCQCQHLIMAFCQSGGCEVIFHYFCFSSDLFVCKNKTKKGFENSQISSLISSSCFNLCFIITRDWGSFPVYRHVLFLFC